MPRLIASLDPKSTMIVFSQNINIMKILRTAEDLNSANRPSRRRERQRRNALNMQALTSLMAFLGKESQKYPSIPKWINAMRI